MDRRGQGRLGRRFLKADGAKERGAHRRRRLTGGLVRDMADGAIRFGGVGVMVADGSESSGHKQRQQSCPKHEWPNLFSENHLRAKEKTPGAIIP